MLRMMTKKITMITKMGTYPELVKCSKAVFERTQDDDVQDDDNVEDDDDDEDTNPKIVDVVPAVFEPAREKPDITLCLGHPQAVGLE